MFRKDRHRYRPPTSSLALCLATFWQVATAFFVPRKVIAVRIPGSSRSAFRDNRDQRSEMMAISIPTSSRSVFRHDGDQMRDVLVV